MGELFLSQGSVVIMKLMTKIEIGLAYFEKTLNITCQVFLGAIIAIIFYGIIMRYVFSHPPAWAEELSRFIFIWMLIFGAIVVTREGSHIELTILIDLLPRRLKFIMSTFTRFLMIGFCVVMIQQGMKIYPIVAEASSPTFGISMGWLYLSIPVGGLLMGIYILENIVKSFLKKV
jgi:TRAP-type C4-dicarboxylate transport system permease small subunit